MFVPLEDARRVDHLRNLDRSKHTPVAIYALYDRRDGCVRYIGKTVCSMSARLDRHFKHPTSVPMREWLSRAGRENVVPEVLEYVPRDTWESYERGWISWFRNRGRLLNCAPGGIVIKRGPYPPPQPPVSVIVTRQKYPNQPKKKQKWWFAY